MQFCMHYPIEFDYYHSISGQDYPMVSNQKFDAIFEREIPNNYIQIDSSEELTVWRKTKYPKRLNHYYLHDVIQNKLLHRTKMFSILSHIAMLIPRDKFTFLYPIWGGKNWFSLNKIAIRYILSYFNQYPEILNRLKYTDCADELIFNSILMKQNTIPVISDNSFRYVDWHPKRDYTSLPLILDERDYDDIINSGMLFCRKVELGKSDTLLDMLDNKINSE